MGEYNSIKFGTDGWRGIIARDFTFDNVCLCAQAMADHLKQSNLAERGLVIGYDTRFASEDFAAACAEVIAGNGIKVYLCNKATPTPVISYGTVCRNAGGAIVITASHNPHRWNGFKIKSSDGASAPIEVIEAVEENLKQLQITRNINRLSLKEAVNKGLVEYWDIAPEYFRKIGSLVDIELLKKANLRIVVDSMYGAGSGYLKKILSGGNILIEEINAERNPIFPGIQPEPIASNLGKISGTVRRRNADAGIATDGDADRIGIIDEKGNFITQLQVYGLLAYYFLEIRKERGAIIKTITTTSMLNKLGQIYGVPVFETKVGFKYIAPLMIKENAMIGGEESGGYGFRNHVPERDGILAGLYFIDFMVRTGKTPSQLLRELYRKVGEHHYQRIDIEFLEEQREKILERVRSFTPESINGKQVVKIENIDGYRFLMKDGSWLLIRFSGTEPLLRIYAESDSVENVRKLLESGKKATGV